MYFVSCAYLIFGPAFKSLSWVHASASASASGSGREGDKLRGGRGDSTSHAKTEVEVEVKLGMCPFPTQSPYALVRAFSNHLWSCVTIR